MTNPFYNTQHSPVGAFASFTLGALGANGGLGLELAGPAKENFWIGCEDRDSNAIQVLPFFQATGDAEAQFGVEAAKSLRIPLLPFAPSEITRKLSAGHDTWLAGDMRFTLFTQAPRLPDPELEDSLQLKCGLVPAVLCEIEIDNRKGLDCRKVVFGWQGSDLQGAMRCVDADDTVGIAQGLNKGFFGASGTWVAGQCFRIEDIVGAVRQRDVGRLRHGVGAVSALVAEVPAGSVSVLHIVACFWKGGVVSSGKSCNYWYTHWWQSLEAVAKFALQVSDNLVKAAKETDEWLSAPGLSPERRWMLAQAVHSYYGSTELLEDKERPGEPLWVVNEGEYRMINTMDLVVDHLFFELERHPWAVRSVLDQYLRDYSSPDSLGLTFRHDMGVANAFSPLGVSAYEQPHLQGCFSYMCQEELVNWILCAVTYAKASNDIDWLLEHRKDLDECMASLVARDHIEEERSIGLMQFDSDRCEGGFEITTYDSLDQSLGKARGNIYLAVKTWAAWLALAWSYEFWEQETDASRAWSYAERAGAHIKKSFNKETNMFPAQLDGSCDSAIIPVIEGLVFPTVLWGKAMVKEGARFAPLLKLLRKHLQTALLARCRFTDGGWKLSESSNNSWLSKVYLCQAIAENILDLKDPENASADRAHLAWLMDPENAFYAWSDQMLSGKVCGSRYYPRGVTAVLWVTAFPK